MEGEKVIPLVIDNGSSSMKGGLGGFEGPDIVFPTVVGRTKHNYNCLIGIDKKD
jgi:actin-related protein